MSWCDFAVLIESANQEIATGDNTRRVKRRWSAEQMFLLPNQIFMNT